MISALGTIIVSARGALIKEAIRDNGSYHAKIEHLQKESLDKVKSHVGVEKVGISKAIGAGVVKETTQGEREDYGVNMPYRYIDLQGYDNEALKMLPFNLKEGRFPIHSDEIAIEYWIADYFDKEVKIGDKINLTLGKRSSIRESQEGEPEETFEKTGEKEYTVVGFIKPNYVWPKELVTKGITGIDQNTPREGGYNAYVQVPDIKNVQEKIESIGKDVGTNPENIDYNNRVLRLYAESVVDTFNKSIIGILIFVVSLIVISTVAVIYNAFNISVLERVSQFGLLRSVGATPKQIRGIVLKEAGILSAIGIPIGLFSGVLAMKIVFYIIGLLKSDIRLINDMEITISATVFLISTFVGLITVFLSAIGPARKAGKVSPLEAVRNTGDLKKENLKNVRSFPFIRKILGVEGEIAHKNLRRNRKRFIITVFSMVISIALFITFSTFSDFMFKIGAVGGEETGDFSVAGYMKGNEDEIYSKLKNMEEVKRVYKMITLSGSALLEDNQINKKIKEINPHNFTEKKGDRTKVPNVDIYTIGDDNLEVLKGVLNKGSIDKDLLNKEKGVLVINNTYSYKENSNAQVLLEGYHVKVGDKIPFASYNAEGEEVDYQDLTVVGVLEKGILDREYNYNASLAIITTEEVFEQIVKDASLGEQQDQYVNMNIELSGKGNRENVTTYLNELGNTMPGFNFTDYLEHAKEARTMTIIMSIFLYGFVTLIALISAINIINTISTNIILRTKEIAMIKAVGMTQGGIKRMVAFESLFYGLYATLIGGTLGVGLSYILFRLVIGISEFQYKLPWENVVIACVGAAIIALLSGIYPLKRINNKIIVESMKEDF